MVGGATPANDITVTAATVNGATAIAILDVRTSSGNITSILLETDQASLLTSGASVIKTGAASTVYTTDTVSSLEYRFYIDTGSGATLHPNLTLYVGTFTDLILVTTACLVTSLVSLHSQMDSILQV